MSGKRYKNPKRLIWGSDPLVVIRVVSFKTGCEFNELLFRSSKPQT